MASRTASVTGLVTVTFAPCTASPCGSTTVPDTVAVFTCARNADAQRNSKITHAAAHTPRLRIPCIEAPLFFFGLTAPRGDRITTQTDESDTWLLLQSPTQFNSNLAVSWIRVRKVTRRRAVAKRELR